MNSTARLGCWRWIRTGKCEDSGVTGSHETHELRQELMWIRSSRARRCDLVLFRWQGEELKGIGTTRHLNTAYWKAFAAAEKVILNTTDIKSPPSTNLAGSVMYYTKAVLSKIQFLYLLTPCPLTLRCLTQCPSIDYKTAPKFVSLSTIITLYRLFNIRLTL